MFQKVEKRPYEVDSSKIEINESFSINGELIKIIFLFSFYNV